MPAQVEHLPIDECICEPGCDPRPDCWAHASAERSDTSRRKARHDGMYTLEELDRRTPPPGRRAIDRMGATPKELDRFAARSAAIEREGMQAYHDEDFREWE